MGGASGRYMSCRLNSLKGGYIGDCTGIRVQGLESKLLEGGLGSMGIKSGTITRVIKGDTRSLDYGLYQVEYLVWLVVSVSRVRPRHCVNLGSCM